MRDSLQHRGPDDCGLWIDPQGNVGLAHRRLAIVDLSAQGHQPMSSASGRYCIVYNGEIYNHSTLRSTLDGVAWRGHSDTETLLALFERYGVLATLEPLVGMFAMAVWDRQERVLTLARDRLGEKPLYWGRLRDGSMAFASELRALEAHPLFDRQLDRDALALHLQFNCVPAPRTIYRSVQKLEPGGWLQLQPGREPRHGHYWRLPPIETGGATSDDPQELLDQLEQLLTEAIGGQMLADVPVGAFLSGGIDSSTIVALLTRCSSLPVRTFCIGFENGATSEAAHARAVASHLGTNHTELILDAASVLQVVPKLGRMYDEPFADSSQIATHLVSRMARQHVTVALSGDAGDELFGGYNRYAIANGIWRRLQRVPSALRRGFSRSLLTLSPSAWDRLGHWLQVRTPVAHRHHDVGDKLHKFARQVLPTKSSAELYEALVSVWPNARSMVIDAAPASTLWTQAIASSDWSQPVAAMTRSDLLGYLPDDILVKVDRASMAVSLETRAPFLDHRVVEFALKLPLSLKQREGHGKWLLRQLLYRYVPESLVERPKQGFAVPLGQWLRGPLRDWAEDLLDPAKLRSEELLDPVPITQAWNDHLSGRTNHQHRLWSVLMFQAWSREHA